MAPGKGHGNGGEQRCFQKQVTDLLAPAKCKVSRYCDHCEDKQIRASHRCYGCERNLCQECHKTHTRELPNHNCVPMSDALFCNEHVNYVVVMYCNDCQKSLCGSCVLRKTHFRHQTLDIEVVAKESRQHLRDFKQNQPAIDKDCVTLKHVQGKLSRARKCRKYSDTVFIKIRKLIEALKTKLDRVERRIRAKLATELENLTQYESDTKTLIDMRDKLVEHATYLTDQASDPDVVEQEKVFPLTRVSAIQSLDDASVELPVLDTTLRDMTVKLQQMVYGCKAEFRKSRIGDYNIEDLGKQRTVPVGHIISGITMDTELQRIVARTNDAAGPLKLYNYQGDLQESLGAGVTGLSESRYRSVCVDLKRGLYLAPCQGTLVLVNRAGMHVNSIVAGSKNTGVAYHKEGDCYLVSDTSKDTVFLIDPETSQVTRQIGSYGSGPTQFSSPYNIHVGSVAGVNKPCILITDYGNHCIKLLDISGGHIRTYGNMGRGGGQIDGLDSVVTDPRGRVVLCDRYNKRIVSFSTDTKGQELCEYILHDDWGGNKPYYLALDTDNMVMAIVDMSWKTLYIYD